VTTGDSIDADRMIDADCMISEGGRGPETGESLAGLI
jgi:hypothetical protein